MDGYREHRYRSACGRLELFARDYPGDSNTSPVLLLMHGLTRNSADFEPVADWLAGPYRLIVPDMRGRGRSSHDPDPVQYRPDVYAGDMFTLLDDLGIARAGLIGTSMGGLMAMAMAAIASAKDASHRIGPVVLNDVGPRLEPAGLARIAGYAGSVTIFPDWQAAAAACARINANAFPDFDAEDWMKFARRTCREMADGVAFDYDPAIAKATLENATAEIDLWPLWPALDNNAVLVVRGAESDLLSAATVAEMGRRHTGHFEQVDVPGRGHAPLLNEPEAREAITRFLARHLPV